MYSLLMFCGYVCWVQCITFVQHFKEKYRRKCRPSCNLCIEHCLFILVLLINFCNAVTGTKLCPSWLLYYTALTVSFKHAQHFISFIIQDCVQHYWTIYIVATSFLTYYRILHFAGMLLLYVLHKYCIRKIPLQSLSTNTVL